MYFELQILITVIIHINVVLHYFITLYLEISHDLKALLYSLSLRQTEKFNTTTSTNIIVKKQKHSKIPEINNLFLTFRIERQNIH